MFAAIFRPSHRISISMALFGCAPTSSIEFSPLEFLTTHISTAFALFSIGWPFPSTIPLLVIILYILTCGSGTDNPDRVHRASGHNLYSDSRQGKQEF